MKKIISIIAIIALTGLIMTGCSVTVDKTTADTAPGGQTADVTDTAPGQATTDAGEKTEATADATPEETGIPAATHQVEVKDNVAVALQDEYNEYKTICPQLFVDGTEATEINAAVQDRITRDFPLKNSGAYVDGFTAEYTWGVRGSVLSIIVHASEITSDYGTYAVFNYDLDTLAEIQDSEFVSRLGMTDEEFFGKTADAYRTYSSRSDIDLEKSIEAINYDNVTPFVTPDGTPAVAGSIYYGAGSQFGGTASVKCFNLTADMAQFYF